MDFSIFIGREVSLVSDELTKLGFKVYIKDNNSGSKKYDTELVVRIKKISELEIEIITSQFLIDL